MSPTGGTFLDGDVFWGDGATNDLTPAGGVLNQLVTHAYAAPGFFEVSAQVMDNLGNYGMEKFGVQIVPTTANHGLTLLAATSTGVYRSVDGGQNWTRTLNLPYVLDLKVDPFTLSSSGPRVLAAVYGKGLYVSNNGGISWREVVAQVGIFTLAFFPSRQGAYAYTCRTGATSYVVRYTLNDGATWNSATYAGGYDADETRLQTVIKTSSSLAVSYDSRYIFAYVESDTTGYVKRIDTYVSGSSTIYSDTRGNGFTIKCAPRGYVYIGSNEEGDEDIVVSDDFGATWTDISESGFTNDAVQDIIISAKDPLHISVLMEVAGALFTITSYDGGASWLGGGAVAAYPLCGVSLRRDPQMFFIGTSTGVYEGAGDAYYAHEVSGGTFVQVIKSLAVLE